MSNFFSDELTVMNRKSSKITRFRLSGRELLAGKYEVVPRLGAGWKGKVYLIRIFYNVVGGPKRYARQLHSVKDICRGVERGLIARKFQSVGKLRQYLENLKW